MNDKSQELRETLVNLIQRFRDNPEANIRNPDIDFLRNLNTIGLPPSMSFHA